MRTNLLDQKNVRNTSLHFMAELTYPSAPNAAELEPSVLKDLARDIEALDNVTFYKLGGVRKYALARYPKPGIGMNAERVKTIRERWMKLVVLNKYVAMKQFHGVIKTNADESVYLVTDYFPGGSLADTSVIGGLTATETMVVIVGVLGQLAMLHKNNLVHRVLSPTRIVLDEKKHPHIVGWSRVNQISREEDVNGGRIHSGVMYQDVRACFLPPEMGPDGGSAHPGVDIWSFAMVCLWLLDCKNRYFGFCESRALSNAKRTASQLPPNFPANTEFQDLLSECLARELDERPTAGHVLAKILRQRIGLKHTNWDHVLAYARENLCSQGVDPPEPLESFLDDNDELEEEEEEAKEE